MSKKFNFAVCVIAAIFLSACDDDNRPLYNDKDPLPRIQSFVWNGTEDTPQQLNGLNEFRYDSNGRVILYATPVQKTSYTYDGLKCTGIMTSIPEGKKLQDQLIIFNNDGHPVSEESTDLEYDVSASMKYKYNTEGRIEAYDFSVSDGRDRHVEFTYDTSTGLISEITVDSSVRGSTKRAKLKYRYYYSDKRNPVALYPECHLLFDAEPALALTGIDGYQRNRLIDKIVLSFNYMDKEMDMEIISFSYEFSEKDKLISITETASLLDEAGNVSQTFPSLKITDIKY